MKSLKYLNKYFLKYRYRLLIGVFITFLSKIFAIQVPSLIRDSLNIVENYNKGLVSDMALVKSTLLTNILLIVGAAIISGFFTFLMRQTLIVMSRLIEFDLKNEVFSHYQTLSQRFFKQNRIGDLMNRISDDVGKVRMYVGPAIMYTINMLVLFIVALFKMFSIDSTLTLYAILPLPILSVSIYYLSTIIQRKSKVMQEYLSKLTVNVQESISGIAVIKSYGIEDRTNKDFETLANDSKDKNIDYFKVQALFFPLMILLIGISNLIVIYVGGMRYINGQIENIGIIAEFIIYVNMLTWPVAVVGWVTSMVKQASVSQKRINEFLEVESEIVSGEKEHLVKGEIEFKNIDFIYKDSDTVGLNNLSFKLKTGETLGIIGKTGAGKSTIVNLLSKLYNADKGEILIDKENIHHLSLESIRKQIGIVPQDAFLFSDSILNNIRFGNEHATEEDIYKVAKIANIHEDILAFAEGYQTEVGERGVTLSGGQKQRIAIARSLISNPRILIFDDCLSAVDTETEEKILTSLSNFSNDITTIVVSHRISSVKNASKIIVLEDGKMIQNGTHNELVNQIGYYQEVYAKQQQED